jgi:competence protein ComEA
MTLLESFLNAHRRWRAVARSGLLAAALIGVFTATLSAELPEGPGRTDVERRCVGCHDLAKAVAVRQDRNGWAATLTKMVGLGMKTTDDELRAILAYLTEHYPAEELPPVNVNKARAIDLESRLSLKRSEAAAILRYREANGDFKSIDDLLKVPGIDTSKIEAKKDQLAF